ncbi:MAG: AzlC family ABC transporter permease [Oscillospiraceae bacterium]|nr:AzlC family ABC transporter permease [Oscillospiraceae bacterium]
MLNKFIKGLRDGIPIALGYLSVSFTFGMKAVEDGLYWWQALLISMTNLTSAGQFAGLSVMAASGPLIEIALTQLVINMRYALMSLSLTQNLDKSFGRTKRWLCGFGMTDEIFAVASGKLHSVTASYMAGLIVTPFIGWSAGTLLGAVAGNVLPSAVQSALSVAIYGMFIAIFVPPMKKAKPVALVVAIGAVMSCAFRFLPILKNVSSGFAIIICAVVAAGVGAWLFPIEEEKGAQV